MNTFARYAETALAMLLVLASWVSAQTDERDSLDPKVAEVVKAMCGTYAGLSAGRIDVRQTISVAESASTSDSVRTVRVLFARPDRIRIEMKDDEETIVIVADGRTRYDYVEALYQYVETQQAGDIASVAGSAPLRRLNAATGRGLMVLELLSRDPYASLMEGVTASRYVGVQKVGDVACHRVELAQRDAVWELWATNEQQPRLLKASADLSRMANAPAGVTVGVTSLFETRELDSESSGNAFVFVAPEDADKVDAFGPMDPQRLVGRTAPDFEIDLLDGGRMKLGDLTGKNIIILDFWATWCGPCRMAMPILAAVAKDYADKGVEFYAVNQEEKEEAVRAFLEETGLSLAVGLDPEARIGNRYRVSGLPQTVIIGKDGTVQVVYAGVPPAFDSLLRGRLDALLQGKNLAEE